jgi:hypothetical protein
MITSPPTRAGDTPDSKILESAGGMVRRQVQQQRMLEHLLDDHLNTRNIAEGG